MDDTLKCGTSPRVGIVAALLGPAYGKTFDDVEKTCILSELSAQGRFYSFVVKVIDLFGADYLCKPSDADRKRILGMNAACSFPDFVDSWNSRH